MTGSARPRGVSSVIPKCKCGEGIIPTSPSSPLHPSSPLRPSSPRKRGSTADDRIQHRLVAGVSDGGECGAGMHPCLSPEMPSELCRPPALQASSFAGLQLCRPPALQASSFAGFQLCRLPALQASSFAGLQQETTCHFKCHRGICRSRRSFPLDPI
jgi:hypothetical protein